MSFKIAELSAFSKAKLGTDDDAIANVTSGGRIVQKNTYYGWVGKIFRMTGAKNANNAVRTELLRALGRAFEINEGIGCNREGKTTFSPRFMDRLSELLGPAFMREDFGIRPDGTVDSGKRNVKIDALEDPWHQILDYVGKVLKTFVSESLDLYIEAEEKDLEDKYPNAIGGACMEAKIENLMNFKCNYLLESGPAAVHDAGMPLQDCMGKEIKLLIEDEKDDSKMTWDYVAKKVKQKLVGQVRPIYTATVERDENDEITSVKYEPARDINGQPLIREVEPEDLDNIGEAVMATIVDGV